MNRKLIRLIYVFILLSSFCLSQDQKKYETNKPIFFSILGVYSTGIVADAQSTQAYQKLGYVEVANPWLYGRHPNPYRFYSISYGLMGAEMIPSYFSQKSHHKWVRYLGKGLEIYAAYSAMGRWSSFSHNIHLKGM